MAKRTTIYPQYTTQKTKDCATRTPLKTGSELRCPVKVSSSCSNSGTRRVAKVATERLQCRSCRGFNLGLIFLSFS
jgi:hypothetical protein